MTSKKLTSPQPAPGRRQPEHHDRPAPAARFATGRLAARKSSPTSTRGRFPSAAAHAKGSGAYGSHRHPRHQPLHPGPRSFPRWAEDRTLRPLHHGGRRAGGGRRAYPRLRRQFYTREGNWDLAGNNTPVFFCAIPLKFPDSNHAASATLHQPAQPATTQTRCRKRSTR